MAKKKLPVRKKMTHKKVKKTTKPHRPVVEKVGGHSDEGYKEDRTLEDALGAGDDESEDIIDAEPPTTLDELDPLTKEMEAAKADYVKFYKWNPTLVNPTDIDHIEKYRFARNVGWYRYQQMKRAQAEGYDWAK